MPAQRRSRGLEGRRLLSVALGTHRIRNPYASRDAVRRYGRLTPGREGAPVVTASLSISAVLPEDAEHCLAGLGKTHARVVVVRGSSIRCF